MAKHEKVSVEQVREKRLAAQQSAAELATEGENAPTMPVDAQQLGGSPDAPPSVIDQQATNAAADTAPPTAPPTDSPTAPSIVVPVVPVIPDLESMIANLSPDQLAKLRVIAASKGVKLPSQSIIGTGTKNVDGSLDVIVHLEPEVVEQLENWSEPGGDTLVEAAQKYITQSLVAFLYGDWSPTPEPVAEPVASVTK